MPGGGRPDGDDAPAIDLDRLRRTLRGRNDDPDHDDPDREDADHDGAHHDGDAYHRRAGTTSSMGDEDLDDLTAVGLLSADDQDGYQPRGRRRAARLASSRRRRRKIRSTLIVLLVMAVIVGGLVAGGLWWRGQSAPPSDWAGTGESAIVVRVQSGDGLTAVAETLVSAGVVANGSVFVDTASDSGALAGLQPGFYLVHQRSSAAAIVAELADPAHRLGHLRIIPGQVLGDITAVSTSGERSQRPGILSTIARACVPTVERPDCFTAADLAQVAATAPLAELDVADWALDAVRAAPDPARRLEGLILPGDYDIEPGSTATEALNAILRATAARWNTTGLTAAAQRADVEPYDLVTIASLIEAEGIGPDMRKISRVIYNRLEIDKKLQFDSTVNYGLDRAQISTTSAERLDPVNAYSTYAHAGLPPTPIGAPGPDALDAAEDPIPGTWLYFVAIDLDGNSCFSTTDAEHAACVDEARAAGVFG